MASVAYIFKTIAPVPDADSFVDIILTKTQRGTPTVIHPGYNISRIRAFYMRKIKFTQQNASEALGRIISSFPRLDDIHPFYADLMNILYDRDHYKLALGQINISKRLIDTLSRDYVRLIKYGDSLYRCKQLKRAAMGRMMTIIKRQKASLSYLEEVRKHLSRLPSIDPNTRTLIVCGYPNVGKSSFMNKVTRADVEVQPYAFTTKSLYVGHMDYRYLRWQVVDTPGILDHPLDERNTIEMQAITALAHLQCSVLYFIDISEECGFTIAQQVALFESIKPLFVNKQLLVVVNKIDVVAFEALSPENRALVEGLVSGSGVEMMQMSNVSEQGVSAVKNRACDLLLQARVDARLSGRKTADVLNRLTVAGAETETEPFIPDSVQAAIAAGLLPSQGGGGAAAGGGGGGRLTEKDRMLAGGGAGVYSMDFKKDYLLADDAWKYDAVPEIMDGKNVGDFFDPSVLAQLDALEREQEQLEEDHARKAAAESEGESDLDETDQAILGAIREKKTLAREAAHIARNSQSARQPRTAKQLQGVSKTAMVEHLEGVGVPTEGISERGRKRTRDADRSERGESGAAGGGGMKDDDDEEGGGSSAAVAKRQRSKSRDMSKTRSKSRGQSVSGARGLSTDAERTEAAKALKKVMKGRKGFGRQRRAGEADRTTGPKLERHMLEGKRPGFGTARSR
jgi:nucleolar GTP-binding protein